MNDEVVVIDAPEPIEPETTEVAEVVEDELKSLELSDSSPEKQVLEEKPKADPVQKRIDELTKKRREAERNSEYWRDQAMKKQPEPKIEPVEEPLKTLADFDYDEGKYQQHLFSKARADAVDEAKRVIKDEQNQQTTSRKVSVFRGRETDFSKSVDDYHEVVTNPNLPINQTMADVAMEMEDGPEVLYYLGKNPDLADEIARLSPLSAARELGRIEAKMQHQKKKGEAVSKAPAPAPKISAVAPSTKKNVDEMTQKEFNKHRRNQIAKRGN